MVNNALVIFGQDAQLIDGSQRKRVAGEVSVAGKASFVERVAKQIQPAAGLIVIHLSRKRPNVHSDIHESCGRLKGPGIRSRILK